QTVLEFSSEARMSATVQAISMTRRAMARFRLMTWIAVLALISGSGLQLAAQSAPKPNGASDKPNSSAPQTTVLAPPADYVIGADDLLFVGLCRDKDLSGEVVVRPDGKISVPLVNDVQAAGLTPEQLRQNLTAAYKKYNEDPTVTVIVRQ